MSEKLVAFISGANRGIGFETARQLGKIGILPVIGSRDERQGKAAVEKLLGEGIESAFIKFDALKKSDHQAAYDYFDKKFGRLDILINNAGVMLEGEPSKSAPPKTDVVSGLSEKILRDTLEANFFSVVSLTTTLLPLVKKANAGRIVSLSSILGSLTLHADPKSPIYGMKNFAYDTSKTALNSFTIHLAFELKETKIKVNSAHPGWVQTEMGGKEAPVKIEDGAKTSVLLATLPASGPSGHFFHMNDPLPF